MTGPLAEYFGRVYASDVHDYGAGFEVGSYIGEGIDVLPPERVDFVIMNPPFSKAEAFLKRALAECVVGVSMFIRIQWLESQGRVTDIFEPLPPTNVSIFAERCGLWAGRWVPRASTATCYTWITWIKEELERGPFRQPTELEWIPVGSLDRFTRPEDAPRYGWNGEQ